MPLRIQQQQIMDKYKQGYLAIPAVPGAGKTTTLAHLTVELIDNGNILIVTFMNSAVGNFKAKIKNILEEKDKNPKKGYEVRTLHSLALNILSERPERVGLGKDVEPIDNNRRTRILNCIVDMWINSHRDEWEQAIEERHRKNKGIDRWSNIIQGWNRNTKKIAAEMISCFKMNGVSPDWLVDRASKERLRWFAELYQLYQRDLINNGLIDFDDMLLKARDLLKTDHELLEKLRSRWAYIFEDEAQDSNPVQEEILYLLAGKGFVRVGDSNQAIMGTFTNSDPSLFRNYCRRDDVEVMPLSVSGRSAQHIINLANYLVDWSCRGEFREALEDLKIEPVPIGEPGPNSIINKYTIGNSVLESSEIEYEFIAHHVSRYVKDNPNKTVAVLVPMVHMAQPLVERFIASGTPCREITNVPFEKKQFVNSILNIIVYLSKSHDNKLFWEALTGLLPLDEYPEIQEFLLEVKLEELFYPIEGEIIPNEIQSRDIWPEIHTWIEQFKYWLSSVHFPVDDLILLIAGSMQLEGEQLAVAHKIANQSRIMQDSNPGWKLYEIARELPFQVEAFVSFATNIADRNGFEPQGGEVNVLTYHKAKGMEWDTVFLAALTYGNFPCTYRDKLKSELWYLPDSFKNPSALIKAQFFSLLQDTKVDAVKEAKKEQIMEKRRLLYVAITRAKENLFLTAHNKDIAPWGSFATGPSESYLALSKYIQERRAKCNA